MEWMLVKMDSFQEKIEASSKKLEVLREKNGGQPKGNESRPRTPERGNNV
jgi:hypothetical protein